MQIEKEIDVGLLINYLFLKKFLLEESLSLSSLSLYIYMYICAGASPSLLDAIYDWEIILICRNLDLLLSFDSRDQVVGEY